MLPYFECFLGGKLVYFCAPEHSKASFFCWNKQQHHTWTHRCCWSGFALRFSSSGYKSPEPSGAQRWWRSLDESLEPENMRHVSYLIVKTRVLQVAAVRWWLWGAARRERLQRWRKHQQAHRFGLMCFFTHWCVAIFILKGEKTESVLSSDLLRRCPRLVSRKVKGESFLTAYISPTFKKLFHLLIRIKIICFQLPIAN